MQIARLFEIVYILLDKKCVTASELAARFEVSARTIYRDIETLSMAGIPVYAVKGKGGGIRLSDGFVLDKSLLSEKEQNEILAALQALGATQYPGNGEVLDKLGAVFQKSVSHWMEVDFSDWGHMDHETFEVIKHAILDRRRIRFEYYSSYGERTARTVEPALLFFKHRNWYLKAYDIKKEDGRIFRLSRMKRVELLDESFEPHPWPEKPYIQTQERPMKLVTIRLKIDPSQLYRIYDEFDESMIKKEADGSFICEATFPEDEWVYGFILSFGPYAQVLEPPHIRDLVKEKLKKTLQIYQ